MSRAITNLFLVALFMFSFFFPPPSQAADVNDAYGFSFASIDGTPLSLADFKDKVVLVVNTASECGFTKQYDGLEKLYQRYSDKGLVVLGVPANDFGGQEPGTESEIKRFCQTKFDVTFPLTAKTIVSGSDAHPFYKWAAEQKKGGLIFSKPRWNFHKYLVARDGSLAGSYSSQTTPDDASLIKEIEAALSAQ